MSIGSRLRQGKRAEQSIELNDVKINSAIIEEVSKKYLKIQWKQSFGSNSMILCCVRVDLLQFAPNKKDEAVHFLTLLPVYPGVAFALAAAEIPLPL